MHLKIKSNPDMVFTGEPELLARLVWDRDFGDCSWLSYKNASWSWPNAPSTASLWVLKCRCWCWKKKPHWWHLVFPHISAEKISVKGAESHGWPCEESTSGRSCSLCPRARFSTAPSEWRIATEAISLPSCQRGKRPNLRELTSVNKAQNSIDYRLCHFPSNLVTDSPRGCLCKEVYFHRKQMAACDTVFHVTFKLTTFAVNP